MHKWFIAILIMALLPCLLQGQETELKSTKAKAAVRDYERKIEDVDEDFEKQLKDLEKSYQMKSQILRARLLSNLNAAMEEEAKRVRLEEATEIKELIKQRKETELPTLDQLKWKAAKAKIPKTAMNFNGHRYQFVLVPTTWAKAKEYCDSVGGHLARLDTLGEQQFLTKLKPKNDPPIWWIDGGELVNEGEWVFSNGEKMANPHITWLRPPEIDQFEGRCVLWDGRGVADDIARRRYPFIIEWEK